MSVAPYTPSKAKSRRSRQSGPANPARGKAGTNLPTLPRHQESLPVKLRAMLLLERGSSSLTWFLVAAALAAYGSTVYVPRLWSQEYGQLQRFQRHERHLTEANETLKHQLARQAENSGLAKPSPYYQIFLPRTEAPNRQPQAPDPAAVPLPLVAAPVAY